MAKAQIITKSGSKVTIEGTSKEVAAIVEQIGGKVERLGRSGRRSAQRAKRQSKQKATPVNLISSLIDGGFFRKPKDLASIKVALEEMGHYYPVTTLSPAMLRFVRRRVLRRIKDKKRWLYTG